MHGVSKCYPGVLALDTVDFSLNAGEVHCLIGENGAGKSTLMKILAGALKLDNGAIVVNGNNALLHSPLAAQHLGIGTIYQEFKLVPQLSVAENIVLGHEPTHAASPFIDTEALTEKALSVLTQLGEAIDPTAIVGTLGVAQRQIVEIAKALSRKIAILIMDEPTAALTERERERLFALIRKLKAEGVGIVFISHRLDEVFDIADRVTVLRDGKVVSTGSITDVDRMTLIRLMVGRDLEREYPHVQLQRGSELLRLEHLNAKGLYDISLSLYQGEILGLAGLVGSGRSELARVVFGADPKISGNVVLRGKEIAPTSPHEAIAHGIGLLTEDRNLLGLVLQMSVKDNITLASLGNLFRGWLIDPKRERTVVEPLLVDLRIKAPHCDVEVETLSGGNRQKVVLARWLGTKAQVLIFDEPTAGVDVGAKYELYTSINALAQRGVGVVVISSDLPELLGICDRIVVMREGKICGELLRSEATQERVMMLATGHTIN